MGTTCMEKIISITVKIFKVKPEEVTDDMSPEKIPSWDSMNYLLFIAELEKEFGVRFGMNEVMDAKNLGDIKKALRAKDVKL